MLNIFNGPKMRQRSIRHVLHEKEVPHGTIVVCTCGMWVRFVPEVAVLTERERFEALSPEFKLLNT